MTTATVAVNPISIEQRKVSAALDGNCLVVVSCKGWELLSAIAWKSAWQYWEAHKRTVEPCVISMPVKRWQQYKKQRDRVVAARRARINASCALSWSERQEVRRLQDDETVSRISGHDATVYGIWCDGTEWDKQEKLEF